MTYADGDDIAAASDVTLINELERRGFYVKTEEDICNEPDYLDEIEKLYLDYMLTGPDFFNTELRKFFNRHLDKTLR